MFRGAEQLMRLVFVSCHSEKSTHRVKLGIHEDTGKTYAVKMMQKSQIRAHEMTNQVRREIAVMKAMRHKNIVNLYEVLMSPKHIYMIMDLVEGGELYDELMRRGPFDENEARVYFKQLTEGMLYCHARGVFHRDLKFDNLLLDKDGVIKIGDFGLVSIKGAGSATELLHTQVGTPHYTAPEIITRASDGYDGVKVDVWSSGIILYGLVAGSLPFMDEDIQVLYNSIVNKGVEWPPEFSPGLVDLLENMFRKDPSQRYSFSDVKRHVWYGEGEGDSEGEPGKARPGRRKRRKNRSIDEEGKMKSAPRSNPSSEAEEGTGLRRTRSSKSLGDIAPRDRDEEIVTPKTPRTPQTPSTPKRSLRDDDEPRDSDGRKSEEGYESTFQRGLRKLMPWGKKSTDRTRSDGLKSPGRSRRSSRDYQEEIGTQVKRSTSSKYDKDELSASSATSERARVFSNLLGKFREDESLSQSPPMMPITPTIRQSNSKSQRQKNSAAISRARANQGTESTSYGPSRETSDPSSHRSNRSNPQTPELGILDQGAKLPETALLEPNGRAQDARNEKGGKSPLVGSRQGQVESYSTATGQREWISTNSSTKESGADNVAKLVGESATLSSSSWNLRKHTSHGAREEESQQTETVNSKSDSCLVPEPSGEPVLPGLTIESKDIDADLNLNLDALGDELSLKLDKLGIIEGLDRVEGHRRGSVGAISRRDGTVASARDIAEPRSPSAGSKGSSVVVPKQDRWGSFTQSNDGQTPWNVVPNQGADAESSLASSDSDEEAEDVTVEIEIQEETIEVEESRFRAHDIMSENYEWKGAQRTPWYDDSEYVGAVDTVLYNEPEASVRLDMAGRVVFGSRILSLHGSDDMVVPNCGHGRQLRKHWPKWL
uniref:non-specific serine/threonine protein kinase n=1 Tax=Rhodosorus marinus TaxID=101924 RepID=A0A7S3A988_9RHOD|mmetsp:Transcript_5764/g.24285  ORF Transcript_5764/g.24285 Transcript_5764/m.24285 type:complete len:884 (+) Transcript_5764:358-3009(+)